MYFHLIILACVYADTYKGNITKIFENYTIKHNWHYENEEAWKRGLGNFIKNFNKVFALNEKSSNKSLYALNMYADMDPGEMEERYAISLKPFVNTKDASAPSILRINKGKRVENITLYDLTKADQLYRDFMKKHNRTIAKKEGDRAARYYKFVKTLVDINRNNFAGHKMKTLNEKADVVKKPNDFY